MRTTTLQWLACPMPACHGALAVSDAVPPSFRLDGSELVEGVLECGACRSTFPVLLGVALLEADLASWLSAFWDEAEAWDRSGDARISRPMRSWLGAPGAFTGLRGPPADAGEERQWSTSPYLQAHFDPEALTGDLPPGWWRNSVQERGGSPDPYSWLMGAAGRLSGGAPAAGLAIDVGTSVGRGAAELAGLYPYAVGVDRSFSAVLTARRLHLGVPGVLEHYSAEVERGRWQARPLARRSPSPALDFVVASGDALPAGSAGASCVAALNVLCAVPDPAGMVAEFARVLAPGGTLLAASPYWSESAGPGGPWDGPDAMRRALAAHFAIREEEDMVPWLLRLTRRRWNVYLSHCVAATRR